VKNLTNWGTQAQDVLLQSALGFPQMTAL